MTFKHGNFFDSPVMRSLEKVAQEKGLIKNIPITKSASKEKKINFTPSSSLLDNVIKLCDGLYSRGFTKQAQDLEDNFLRYRQAQTLYETSPEKGKDLIEAAHPKGSHKLEDVNSDEAVFEDILDQMAKSLQVVNKEPTGKLSNAQAIKVIRNIFAQEAVDTNKLQAQIEKDINIVVNIVDRIKSLIKSEIPSTSRSFWLIDDIKEKATNLSIDNFKDMLSYLGSIKYELEKHWYSPLTGLSEQSWSQIEPLLNEAMRRVNNAISNITTTNNTKALQGVSEFEKKYDAKQEEPKAPSEPKPSDKLSPVFDTLINRINRDIARVQARGLDNATQLTDWLNKARDKFVVPFKDQFARSEYKDDQDVINSFTAKITKINSQMDAFEQKWLT